MAEDGPPSSSNWKAEMIDKRRRRKCLAKLAKLKERIADSSFRIEGLEEELELHAQAAAAPEDIPADRAPA